MEVLVLFVFWAAAMVAAVAMAGSRGRSQFGWFLLAFFFGWIAVLFLAIAGDSRQKREADEMRRMMQMRAMMRD